ncbi:MAG: tRNA pseudouridine(55) synthase TruB [Acidobacteriota bacterium]
MNGFINIYKPANITSYDVIRRIKPVLKGIKIGHLGTLDPMAEGVLPIALGYATRLLEYINDNTKEYIAEMILGGISDTQDRTGNIVWISDRTITPNEIREVLTQFTGEIMQIPPMYSAVHHQGQRLYELARKGISVDVEPRMIKIIELELLDFCILDDRPRVRLRVVCSSGTYIRTLCHDIGQVLECGAFMSGLVRSRSGPFTLKETAQLEDLTASREDIKNKLLSPEFPVPEMPRLSADDKNAAAIYNGMAVPIPGVVENAKYLMFYKEDLIAVGRGVAGKYEPLFQPEKVLNKL